MSEPIPFGSHVFYPEDAYGPPWVQGCDCGSEFTKDEARAIGQALLNWANSDWEPKKYTPPVKVQYTNPKDPF